MGHLTTKASEVSPQLATVSASSGNDGASGIYARLQPSGARFENHDIPDFGDPRAEGATALTADVVAPLADHAVIGARGADAETFLQGQLSNDLRELTSSRAQISSYNTPKGRVLAVFTLMRRPDSIWLETQASVAAATLKRLRMFVMRSKVTLDDAGAEAAGFGVSGPNARALLETAGIPVPELTWGCVESGELIVIRRPSAGPARYSLHGPVDALMTLWPRLSERAKPVGTTAWRLLDLVAGLPAIHSETSEQHVAQMLNLDKLEGISFAKGCYPGQEIVARLHYLGSLKRRLFVGFTEAHDVKRGTSVFTSDGSTAQAVGDVLDLAPHPTRGHAVQVVLQLSHRDAPLRIGAVDGSELTLA